MGTLSSLFVERGVATMGQVEEAIARQVLYGGDLATNLLELLGNEKEGVLVAVLAQQYRMRPVERGPLPRAREDVLGRVPSDTAFRHGFYPLGIHEGTLLVAVSEPLPPPVKEDLAQMLGIHLIQIAAPAVRIRQALRRDYGIAIDRRLMRLLAKLDGAPDPYPSDLPPRPLSQPPSNIGGSMARSSSEVASSPSDVHGPMARSSFEVASSVVSSTPFSVSAPPVSDIAEQKPSASKDNNARQALRSWVRDEASAKAKQEWRRRGPLIATDAKQALGSCEHPDEALQVFFEFAQQYFLYSVLFLVQGDLAEGRDAYGPGADRNKVRGIGLALDLPSCLSHARERGVPVCARLEKQGLDAALRTDLERASVSTAFVLPLLVRTRCVALFYADESEGGVTLSQAGEVISFASLLGPALERMALRRKLQQRQSSPPSGSSRPSMTPAKASLQAQGTEALARAFGLPTRAQGSDATPIVEAVWPMEPEPSPQGTSRSSVGSQQRWPSTPSPAKEVSAQGGKRER